jgi:hypothetical protein
MLPYCQLRDQRHNHKARHLCHCGNRCGESSPGDKPIVDSAVDAKLERSRPIHPSDAKQKIEDEQRLVQRQQQHRDACDEHREAQSDARAVTVEARADQRR